MNSARPDLLALNLSHFHELCKAVSTIHFTNPKKIGFQNDLYKLSEKLLEEDVYAMTPPEVYDRLALVNFFQQWALAFDGRSAYTLTREMRGVIENLCAHWIPESDKYVFALTDGGFSVLPYDTGWDIMIENVKNAFNVKFAHQLVLFRVPKQLAGDFLYSSVLYHEMGHFIDSYYNISEQVFKSICDKQKNNQLPGDFVPKYFPFILNVASGNPTLVDKCLKKQIGEYVADVFGAQYVGEHICNLMESAACGKYDNHDFEHPSPNYRERMVRDFMSCSSANLVLNEILEKFSDCGLELKNRQVPIADAEKIRMGEVLDIKDDDELHSIIGLGWEVYFNKPTTMESKIGLPPGSIDKHSFYKRINSSIKESIRQYFGFKQ